MTPLASFALVSVVVAYDIIGRYRFVEHATPQPGVTRDQLWYRAKGRIARMIIAGSAVHLINVLGAENFQNFPGKHLISWVGFLIVLALCASVMADNDKGVDVKREPERGLYWAATVYFTPFLLVMLALTVATP